jgi:hypothetical protein
MCGASLSRYELFNPYRSKVVLNALNEVKLWSNIHVIFHTTLVKGSSPTLLEFNLNYLYAYIPLN